MGAQRKGRHGDRHRRLHRRRPRLLRPEARRPERGGGPALHRGLHRRQRRPGHRGGGRPRHVLLPERTGLPPLRESRQGPHARAGGLRRVQGVHQTGVRTVRTVRHPGLPAAHHPHRPLLQQCGSLRAGRGPREGIHQEQPEICHAPGQRHPPPRRGGGPPGR